MWDSCDFEFETSVEFEHKIEKILAFCDTYWNISSFEAYTFIFFYNANLCGALRNKREIYARWLTSNVEVKGCPFEETSFGLCAVTSQIRLHILMILII